MTRRWIAAALISMALTFSMLPTFAQASDTAGL